MNLTREQIDEIKAGPPLPEAPEPMYQAELGVGRLVVSWGAMRDYAIPPTAHEAVTFPAPTNYQAVGLQKDGMPGMNIMVIAPNEAEGARQSGFGSGDRNITDVRGNALTTLERGHLHVLMGFPFTEKTTPYETITSIRDHHPKLYKPEWGEKLATGSSEEFGDVMAHLITAKATEMAKHVLTKYLAIYATHPTNMPQERIALTDRRRHERYLNLVTSGVHRALCARDH